MRRHAAAIAVSLWMPLPPPSPPPLLLPSSYRPGTLAAAAPRRPLPLVLPPAARCRRRFLLNAGRCLPCQGSVEAGLAPLPLQADESFASASVAAIGRRLRGLRSLRLQTLQRAGENALVELSGAVCIMGAVCIVLCPSLPCPVLPRSALMCLAVPSLPCLACSACAKSAKCSPPSSLPAGLTALTALTLLRASDFGGRAMSALLPLTQLCRFSLTGATLTDDMLACVLPRAGGSTGTDGEGQEGQEEEEDDDLQRLLPSLTYLSVQGLQQLE